jgi:hypothetical protein
VHSGKEGIIYSFSGSQKAASAEELRWNTKIWEIDMTAKPSYKIITTVGEESSKGNTAFEKLE